MRVVAVLAALAITAAVAFVTLQAIGGQRHLSRGFMYRSFVEEAPVYLRHQRRVALERAGVKA